MIRWVQAVTHSREACFTGTFEPCCFGKKIKINVLRYLRLLRRYSAMIDMDSCHFWT